MTCITTSDLMNCEMVVRVAKAIRDSEYGVGSKEPHEPWLDDAYAAIRAMREMPARLIPGDYEFCYVTKGAWEAIIDAATEPSE